jgi:DNA-binding MarR family transcriptional regulator
MSLDSGAVRSWLSVVRAYNLCDVLMTQRLATLGVRTAEHEVLANLLREPGMSQQALAARCFSAKSHISGLVGQLEERGLVRRDADPADARAKRLSLTRAGEALAQRTGAVQAEVVKLMAQALPAREMALVERAMNRVSDALVTTLTGASSSNLD